MRINITGMQGNRLVIKAALPDMVAALPHNWTLEDVDRAITTLQFRGVAIRSNAPR